MKLVDLLGQFAAVALGGAVGSCLRFATVLLAQTWGAPIGAATTAVNVVGALAIGWLLGDGESAALLPDRLRPLVVAGLLGGLTTFSSLAYEVVLQSGPPERGRGLMLLLANLLLGLGAVWLGMRCAEATAR